MSRARATGVPAVFWLDDTRAHDAQLIAKVKQYLPEHNTDGLEFPILAPWRPPASRWSAFARVSIPYR